MASMAELEKRLQAAREEHEQLQAETKNLKQKRHQLAQDSANLSQEIGREAEKNMGGLLDQHADQTRAECSNLPLSLQIPWKAEDWRDYRHDYHAIVPFLPVGLIQENQHGRRPFAVPFVIPFIGRSRTTVIECTEQNLEEGLWAMQAMVERIAVTLPHTCSFCLLDPERLGASFPMQKNLTHVRNTDLELSRTLHEILADISRINQEYLSRETDSFEKLPDQIRSTERFEFIFAANFPKDYDRRSVEYLQKISKTGPQAGKYVFLHYNREHALPADTDLSQFSQLHRIPADPNRHRFSGPFQFSWAAPADAETERIVFDGLRAAKPVEHNLDFSTIQPLDSTGWWKEDATREIRVPIGGSGGNHRLELWFGTAADKRQCSHGMLGAMTGSGKSNLYHVFICGLAARYSPSDVQLYLIDGKQGVEFQAYRDLPHARVVSLHTTPRLARSVLEELVEVMERRNEMFQEISVVDLPSYREQGSPRGQLPRILLIVDEFQTLFEDGNEGEGSRLMLALASQGRSAGIHMFVGSQRFGASNMLNQAAILGNMHLRVAMKMTDADIAALTEFGKSGKARIRACDVAGKVVINDAAGDDGSNASGKVALLKDEEKTNVIQSLIEKSERTGVDLAALGAVLFNGREQPALSGNPQIKCLFARHPRRPDAKEWQAFAQTPQHERGLGESEWYAGEAPAIFWLGQEFNIHGQTRVILRRRQQEHLLIVGEAIEARLGLASVFLSLIPVNHRPDRTRLYVIDRSVVGSPWNGVLEEISTEILRPLGCDLSFSSSAKDLQPFLSQIFAEWQRRSEMAEEEVLSEPPVYLLIHDAHRLTQLEKEAGRHGLKEPSEAGALLSQLLAKGSELGIHCILTYNGVRPLQQVFDAAEINQFRHRVAFQMTEDESFDLLRSRQAALLQEGGKKPILALYANPVQNLAVRFKPYCFFDNARANFFGDLRNLQTQVEGWAS